MPFVVLPAHVIVDSCSGCGGGPIGQTTMAASAAVTIASDQSAVHVIVDTMPAGGSGLTDLELRATPVPISGAVTNAALTDVWNNVTHTLGVQNDVLTIAFDAANQRIVVDGSQVTQPVSGTVTAVQATGTNLHVVCDSGCAAGAPGQQTMANSSPVVIASNQSAVPISAAALPLPSGASTGALQTTGNTSVGSIDTKTPALGQALAAASVPVVLTAAQVTTLTPPAAIAGFALEAGHLAAIDTSTAKIPALGQALAASSVPVVLTAAQLTTLTPVSTVTANAGTNLNTSALALEATLGSVKTAVEVIDNAVSGAGFNTTQFGGTNVSTGTGAGGAGIPRVTVSNDSNVLVTPPTLTKGTQGATGLTIQELKDAGRTAISFYTNTFASGATTVEKIITWDQSKGTGAITAATASYTITSGKTLRIMALSVATRGHLTPTIQTTTFKLRLNTAGACVVTSTPILLAAESATPATASAWDRVIIPMPDGYEIAGNGTIALCITAASTFTTNAPTWNVNLVGYEY